MIAARPELTSAHPKEPDSLSFGQPAVEVKLVDDLQFSYFYNVI